MQHSATDDQRGTRKSLQIVKQCNTIGEHPESLMRQTNAIRVRASANGRIQSDENQIHHN